MNHTSVQSSIMADPGPPPSVSPLADPVSRSHVKRPFHRWLPASFFLPSATARIADQASWLQLLWLHLTGLLPATLLLPLLSELWFSPRRSLGSVVERMWGDLLFIESAHALTERLLMLGFLMLLMEVALVVLAGLLNLWNRDSQRLGARFLRTWRRTLAGTRLLTGIAISNLLLLSLWRLLFPHHYYYWGGFSDMQGMLWWFFTWLWGVVAFCRLAGYGWPRPRSFWPPACDRCGYPLTHLGEDPRPRDQIHCPECGRALADALSPENRGGTAWDNRRPGLLSAAGGWLKTTRLALFQPAALGTQVRLGTPMTSPRGMIAIQFLMVLGILVTTLTLGMLLVLLSSRGSGSDAKELLEITAILWLIALTLLTPWCFSIHLGLLGLAALLLSAWNQRHTQRPLSEGILQVLSYQGVLGPIALSLSCAGGLMMMAGFLFFEGWMETWLGNSLWLSIVGVNLMLLTLLLVHGATFVLGLLLAQRAVGTLRHANL